MKNKSLIIGLIIILVIICAGLTVLFTNLLSGKLKFSNFKFNNESAELVLDEVYELDFSKIKVNTEAGNVYIKTNNENNVRVVIYGDKENTTVDTTNGLSIDAKAKQCVGFCFNRKIYKLEIYLPENYDKEITINNNYGNIEIDKFINANMNIYEDCGNIEIIGANNVKVENDYGNIEIKEVNDADVKASAGNVEIGTVSNLKVQNDYGNVEVDKVLNYVNIEEDCGDVEIKDLNITIDSKITNDLGNIKINKTNEVYINASTDLGKVEVNNNYKDSLVTLTIENDCGDVKVNN